MNEKWVTIAENPRYAVSNEGRVQNLETGRILKPTINSAGYPQVGLYFGEGTQVKRTIHQLVSDAFLNCDRNLEVDHIDRIRNHSYLSNLRCATHSDNMLNRETGGKSVRVIETGQIFESLTSCAEVLNLDRGAIGNAIRNYRRRKSHGGYTFEFVE